MKKWILSLLLMFMLAIPVSAEGEIPIYTPADLDSIRLNPAGSYILMNDLDMTGVDWSCPDFTGTLDGNGYGILNLTVTRTGATTDIVRDGNVKEYEAEFAGLFGKITDAKIMNLKLINMRAMITSDKPCMVGAIAGFSDHSEISNVEILATMELRAWNGMFGVGGVLGYGSGAISDSKIDTTMICVDTDETTKDEQFLGGVYGTGYAGITNSEIKLDAYISEHGYVHSGGVTGMFMEYPIAREGDFVHIDDNTIKGKITFFEHNPDRRAYCEPAIGEFSRIWHYSNTNNPFDFLRDERWEYDKELRPEMCENPQYSEVVNAATCDTYGFTEFTCQSCGYTYTDRYTLGAHKVVDWEVTLAPTSTTTGISQGTCTGCGAVLERVEETLPPETEPVTVAAAVAEEAAAAPVEVMPQTDAPAAAEPTVTQVAPTEAPASLTDLVSGSAIQDWILVFALCILLVTIVLLFAVLFRAIRRR